MVHTAIQQVDVDLSSAFFTPVDYINVVRQSHSRLKTSKQIDFLSRNKMYINNYIIIDYENYYRVSLSKGGEGGGVGVCLTSRFPNPRTK